MRRLAKIAGVTATFALLVSACSGPVEEPSLTNPADGGVSLSPSAGGLSPSPTVEVSPKPTMSTPARVFVYSGDELYSESATVNPDGSYGSGCTPPSGDTLPDGVWAVYVTDWAGDGLQFDLVCVYGPASQMVIDAMDSCNAEWPGEGERCQIAAFVINNNPRLRYLPASADATFDNGVPLGEAPDEITIDVVPSGSTF